MYNRSGGVFGNVHWGLYSGPCFLMWSTKLHPLGVVVYYIYSCFEFSAAFSSIHTEEDWRLNEDFPPFKALFRWVYAKCLSSMY